MIRVLVVDDQTLVRQGICSLLKLANHIEVVAETSHGQEALEWLKYNSADVMLLDLRMPVMDGVATLKELQVQQIPISVIVLTTFDDDELVMASIEAGARGFLLKDVTLQKLVNAIDTVHRGERLFQPVVTGTDVAESEVSDAESTSLDTELSLREREILRLMAAGYSNKEIARALNLAEGTIKNRVSDILQKLGVRDRTRAVFKAMEKKLL